MGEELRQDQIGGTDVAGDLRELRRQVSELTSGSASRIEQLQRDLAAMTTAAIAREREYATRENELNAKLLNAVTQGHAAKFDAGQLSEKLAAAENLNRALTAQAVQIEGTLRAQAAQIGGLEGAKAQLAAECERKLADAENVRRSLEEKLHEAEAAREELHRRVTELADARSRRLLMKVGLVGRCAWETA